MKYLCDNPTEVAKEMFWLAFQACEHPLGMGWLQDRPGATKEDVWSNVSGGKSDYAISFGTPTKPTGDYVFGRMMKLYVEVTNDGIIFPDGTPRDDYQSWAVKYPTYLDLVAAAEDAVEIRSKV